MAHGDAAIDPGTDAAVPVDVGTMDDPLNASPTCTTGHTWRLGNLGNAVMNPGLACIQCHMTDRRAPVFTAAGTVYATGHEPDLCNGPNVAATATIEIHDAAGQTVTLRPNSVGNFYYQGPLTMPITASVHSMGRTRDMVMPAASGDCNSCHTQNGLMDAPGRITLP